MPGPVSRMLVECNPNNHAVHHPKDVANKHDGSTTEEARNVKIEQVGLALLRLILNPNDSRVPLNEIFFACNFYLARMMH